MAKGQFVFTQIEKFAGKLPGGLRGSVLDHVGAVRALFAHGYLDAARQSHDLAEKLAAARQIVSTTSALCATVGIEPIPLADFPILTSLQAMMVSGIIYVSGREVSKKAAGEFLAAMGANLSAGLVLREGARAVAKLLPGWGNAVSGAIAGAGTYAVGRAATAYFIENASIKDARELFRREKKLARKKTPPALLPPVSQR